MNTDTRICGTNHEQAVNSRWAIRRTGRTTAQRIVSGMGTAFVLSTLATSAWAHDVKIPSAHASVIVSGQSEDARRGNEARDRTILALKQRLSEDPKNVAALGRLGLVYLDEARSTEEARFYTQAESLFTSALRIEPTDFASLVGSGSLALSRHDFRGAMKWAERGLEQYPESAPLLGIVVDASIELGRYEDARRALDTMLAVKPDLAAYSRASYLRELHGDLEGAVEAMSAAAEAGRPESDEAAWCRTHVGDLHFKLGRLDRAERAYRETDATYPGYPRALAGLARLAAARGDLATATLLYETVVEAFPSAQYRTELGDVYQLAGALPAAEEQFHLVRHAAEEARAAGMNVDLEMALFEVEHGADPNTMVIVAEDAYLRRPSVTAAHVYAWTLYRADRVRDALTLVEESLRLGTRDPEMLYRAGRIYQAAGQVAKARQYLEQALAMNPKFSPRESRAAVMALAELR